MPIILAILLSLFNPVFAQSMLNISADDVIFDHERQHSSYRGNVILEDTNAKIKAHQIDYFKKEDTYNIIAIGNNKQPAIYHNTNDNIKISAQKINYSQQGDIIIFSGKVVVINEGSRLEGDELNYYIKDRKIISNAKPGNRISSLITLN